MNEIERKQEVKKNGERGISEFLSNTPENHKNAKKPNPENNIEIFDKENVGSEEIDFEEMKEDAFINKAEEILDNSNENGEKEVRLTEVIEDGTKRANIPKNKTKSKRSSKRKSGMKSKGSSKYSSQSSSKRKFGAAISKSKSSNLKNSNTFKVKQNSKRVTIDGEPVLTEKGGKRKYSSDLDEEESSAADEESEEIEEEQKSLKTKHTRVSRNSEKSKSLVSQSDISEYEYIKRKYPRLVKITNSTAYMISYFISYYFLALNDHFRIILLSKSQDTLFLVLTFIFLFVFLFNIMMSSMVEPGYFLRFFFYVD